MKTALLGLALTNSGLDEAVRTATMARRRKFGRPLSPNACGLNRSLQPLPDWRTVMPRNGRCSREEVQRG
jgi:hypothetical protein